MLGRFVQRGGIKLPHDLSTCTVPRRKSACIHAVYASDLSTISERRKKQSFRAEPASREASFDGERCVSSGRRDFDKAPFLATISSDKMPNTETDLKCEKCSNRLLNFSLIRLYSCIPGRGKFCRSQDLRFRPTRTSKINVSHREKPNQDWAAQRRVY